MKKNFIKNIFATLALALLASACATVSHPTGGEKDVAPPALLEAKPKNNTTLFDSKEIHLHFDEFVVLKDINNEFLISPPMNKKPEIKLYGKSIRILFKDEDTLKPNTTYHLSFGNGIADNNEGNVLTDFSYVFSTGSYLDSMYVKGQVINSFTLQPEKGILLGLYKNAYDSIVAKEKPFYIARTDSMGNFRLKHLQNEKYHILALKDMNSNMLYDLPTEEVAFLNEEVVLQTAQIMPDTLKTLDTLLNTDSTALAEKKKSEFAYTLRLFPTPDEKQRITYAEFSDKKNHHLMLVAKKPLKEPKLNTLSTFPVDKYFTELSKTKDTLHVWYTSLPVDSTLIVRVEDGGTILDTLRLKLSPAEEVKKKKGDDTIQKLDPLALKPNFGTQHPFFKPLELAFEAPLQTIDSAKAVQIIYGADTLYPSITFADEFKRKLLINFPVADKADSTLKIQIIGGKFVDIYGLTNDTTNYTTTIQGAKSFGNIYLNFTIKNPDGQYIVQLLGEKDVIVQEYIAAKEQKISFTNLNPGNYRIKMIEDKNLNNIWDTGNYWLKKQPETVRFFEKTLSVKANWDLEENLEWNEKTATK